MAEQPLGEYVLGIDLGTNSLGWAIVGLVDGEPAKLVRAGVRVFEAGMEGDIESGREESRNKARRDARLHRRQLRRHRRRLIKIAHFQQRAGLLPAGNVSDPESRQDFFNRLDSEIVASDWFAAKEKSGLYPEPRQVMPYILRAAALDEKLEPHSLGRALYHLAQRRGFLSNRKQVAKKDDDEGKVKEGIAELRRKMQEANSRTLGEYFSQLKPSEERIRSRWTARDMYEKEFDAIWSAQAAHHPDLLTEEHRKELHKAIFYQRPLWFDPNTIGTCELEPDCRRAPAYLLVAQRYRLLQTVNNLTVLPPDDVEMPLTPADRKKLVDELETKGHRTFKQISKLLKLEKGYAFNLERGGEKTLKGSRTNADFYKVFGDRWLKMTPQERDQAVEYVHAFQRPDKLKGAAMKKWSLNAEDAEKLAEISLEPEYMKHSRRAIEKLLPWLEQGASYGEARKAVYPESFKSGEPAPLLPPVEQALEIRNPAVTRSLTELRKVVNAVVRQYGKPQEIRIELTRDLKKSRKQREAISKINRQNESARADAAKKIMAEAGIKEPKPDDLRKYLLAEECHWMCPYTGKSISMQSLFGPEPQFDIEHIIPFSRSMDSTFQNLTLCFVPENRSVKGNKTPHQAYNGDSQKYEDIKDRVKKFQGDRRTVSEKLKRFLINDEELEIFLGDFRERQLNDTAYSSKLAKQFLGIFYGGDVDSGNKRRVQATSGRSTAYFRNLWKLNAILNDGPTRDGGYKPKSREDHRHHAVDAVVIGLTDAGMIKRLSDAAQRAPVEGRKRFGSLEGPWPNFTHSVSAEIDKIIVSHRVSKKVSGALHEETIYSRPFAVGEASGLPPSESRGGRIGRPEAAPTTVRVRKPLAALTKNEVEDIADPGVKALVVAKLNGGDPKKVFASEANLPKFPQSGVLIKRVRISKAIRPFVLGKGRSARHVTSESNHHVEIYAEIDKNGNEGRWDGEVVTMHEAYQRIKAGKPVVQRDHGPLVRFVFSLAPHEVIECDDEKSGRALWVSRGVASYEGGPRLLLVPLNDARQKKEIVKAGRFWSPFLNPLRKLNPRKVVVSPLGEVSDAHD
jgi:CRISPR-associated endonuclease Csn1